MAKIKVVAMSVDDNYMYVIDDKDKIWRRHLPNGQWDDVNLGELPDEVEPPRELNIQDVVD